MVYTRPTFGTIFHINWRFMWAYLWGWLAYLSWPTDPGLWGFYILSVICGLICWALVSSNFKRIASAHRRDREVAKFNKNGTAPRSDRMAGRHDLKAGGLLR